jgi:5-methylcytosine-specific restriction endonuclease McrA
MEPHCNNQQGLDWSGSRTMRLALLRRQPIGAAPDGVEVEIAAKPAASRKSASVRKSRPGSKQARLLPDAKPGSKQWRGRDWRSALGRTRRCTCSCLIPPDIAAPTRQRDPAPGGPRRGPADDEVRAMGVRGQRTKWDAWYSSARWARIRRYQLLKHPLCKFCLERGVVTPAETCDHIEPHRGDVNKFWLGPFQSLCKQCHDSTKRFVELHGFRPNIGPDGWPLDPRHPVYRGRGSR